MSPFYSLVSVPLRGLWFLSSDDYDNDYGNNDKQFPSPCGDYGSYLLRSYGYCPDLRHVSVPLRGLWFLSAPNLFRAVVAARKVSVPLRGLWFLSATYEDIKCLPLVKFPSPCGDYGSYLLYTNMGLVTGSHRVSVPLRGLWFLSFKGDVWDEKLQAMRFRPLAGIMVLISLIRDNNSIVYLSGFRPLAGIMVLIKNSLPSSLRPIQVSFRPLAGIMVLIKQPAEKKYKFITSFRPLAGIMVLIFFAFCFAFCFEDGFVSVPLRGLWFLSCPHCGEEHEVKDLFPSPCGDYGSYRARQHVESCKALRVSVPLRGLWFLSPHL